MKALLLTLNLLYGGDAVTTHLALSRGAHELITTQNPFVTDALLGTKAITVSCGLVSLSREHPKAARVLGWTLAAVGGAVVVHNMSVIRTLR